MMRLVRSRVGGAERVVPAGVSQCWQRGRRDRRGAESKRASAAICRDSRAGLSGREVQRKHGVERPILQRRSFPRGSSNRGRWWNRGVVAQSRCL